jgi:hypothetical protein
MAPAPPGRRRMGGCETTPPTRAPHPGTSQRTPPSATHNRQAGLLPRLRSSAAACRRQSSFVLARALTGATGCGRSSLTHGRAAARNPAPARKDSTTVPTPARRPQQGHRASPPCSLDKRFPHGWVGGHYGVLDGACQRQKLVHSRVLKRTPHPGFQAGGGRQQRPVRRARALNHRPGREDLPGRC